MKKSLIALAVLAAATAASAQSSVTLYGKLDLGLKSTSTTDEGGAVVKTTSMFGAEGVNAGSRLGVKGSEDLGGGLKAGFTYELGTNADNSAASAVGKTRVANLTLNGGFGQVQIGTFWNAFDDVAGISPKIGVVNGAISVPDSSENALRYTTPSFSGFTASIDLNSTKLDSSVNADDNKTSKTILGLAYNAGKLGANFAYGTDSSTVGTAAATKIKDLALSASYDLGMAVPHLIYAQNKQNDGSKTTGIELGAKFPMGALTPYITVGQSKDKSASGANGDKMTALHLGTTYDLSKRTSLYAAYGQNKTKTSTGTQTGKGTGYALGVMHNF